MRRLILALALFVSSVSAARDPRPYDIGWFADAEGTVSELFVTQLVPFSAHAVLFDVDDDIAWFQLGIGLPHANVFVLQRSFFGPAPSDAEVGDVEPGLRSCGDEHFVLTRSLACRDQYPDGSMILNPTIPCLAVNARTTTFTALKSRFD